MTVWWVDVNFRSAGTQAISVTDTNGKAGSSQMAAKPGTVMPLWPPPSGDEQPR